MRHRRTPRPVGEAIGAALEGTGPATLLAAVQSAWAGAVGEAIAREAAPVSERDGVITVACTSATWAQELDLLRSRILGQIRAELPDPGAISGIRFTATGDADQVLS